MRLWYLHGLEPESITLLSRTTGPESMLELIENAEIYTPEPFGRGHILVVGEKIAWIGHEIPEIPNEFELRRTDVQGSRVIPGLIDGHVHITGGGGESGEESRVPPLMVSDLSSAGVTTVVGLLGTDDSTRDTAGLLATARGLHNQGLTAYCYTGGYHIPPRTLTGSVRSDIVHLERVIGVGEIAISDHRSSQPTLDELLRIASEAHVGGLLTKKAGVVHLHMGNGDRGLEMIRQAIDKSEIPARVFFPTHVNRRRALFEEAMSLTQLGCSIDVTAYPMNDKDDGWFAEEAVARYLRAGLPAERITVSSDGGGSLPRFDKEGNSLGMGIGKPSTLLPTLARILESDIPLARALPPFTSNVARILKLFSKGQLCQGADADLVAVDDSMNPVSVMARGKWHMREGEVVERGFF